MTYIIISMKKKITEHDYRVILLTYKCSFVLLPMSRHCKSILSYARRANVREEGLSLA